MTRIKFMLTASVSLLFIACSSTQPSFNPNNKEMKLVDGKQYMIPVGTSTSNAPVSSKVIKFYQDMGLSSCKLGDITWEEQTTADSINSVMRSGSKEEGIAIYHKAAKEGKIGCASPHNTDKE